MAFILPECDSFEMAELRDEAFRYIERLWNRFGYERLVSKGFDEATAASSTTLKKFGSFALNSHLKSSDIDVLCVGTKFIERSDFEIRFIKEIAKSNCLSDLKLIASATVPVVKVKFTGEKGTTDIDVTFARLTSHDVRNTNLDDTKILRYMSPSCVTSMNGYRGTKMLRELAGSNEFGMTLRALRLWRKNWNIEEKAEGFLPNISWAIMATTICSNSSCAPTLIEFFAKFAVYDFSTPIRLDSVDTINDFSSFGEIQWIDNDEPMKILTPTYPTQNTAKDVGIEAANKIKESLKKANEICNDIEEAKCTWDDLFKRN